MQKLQRRFERDLGKFLDQEMKPFYEAMDVVKADLDRLLTQEKLTPEDEFKKEIVTSWMIFLADSMAEADKSLEPEEAKKALEKLIRKGPRIPSPKEL